MPATPKTSRRWLALVAAWIFGAVFVWSGWLKVQDPALFLVNIRSFRMLPDPFAAWLALTLPWLEIFAGLAVLTGWLRRGGVLLLNAALVVFAIALLTAWARGLNIECGCFGSAKSATILEALVRDAVLLALGWVVAKVTSCKGDKLQR
ncbi:MAG: MauE/DoxX family redox-associated membrane protein [Roseimicrobium sp.]